MKQKFIVTGMTCSACSAHVDKAVRKLEGVEEVNVNLLGGTMTVEWHGALTAEEIASAVVKAGYGASVPQALGGGRRPGEAGGPGDGGRSEKYEPAADCFHCLYGSAVLPLHGAYDGLAYPRLLPRDGERHDLRPDAVSADHSHVWSSIRNTSGSGLRPCGTARPRWIP